MQIAYLDDVQDCIDAMSQAVRECDAKEWTQDEMWLEIEAQCQILARLSEAASGEVDEDNDAVAEDDDEVEEINFDGDEVDGDSGFEEDEAFN